MDQMTSKELLNRINMQLKSAVTVYAKIQLVNYILNSSPEFIDMVGQSSSMKMITQYLRESLKCIQGNEELVDKIFMLLLRMNLNDQMLRESEMGLLLIKIKEKRLFEDQRANVNDHIQQKWMKIYAMYRSGLEDLKKNNNQKDKYEERKKKVKRNQSSSSDDSSNKRKKNRKKNVRFARDDILMNYKYFKRDDEPNQRGMTIEEVIGFQKLYSVELKRLNQINGYDIKHRESMMEGQEHKLQLDNIQQMIEQIPFIRPLKLHPTFIEVYETNFKETQKQQSRTESKMSAFYNRDQIPDQPGYSEISNTQSGMQPRAIHLDPPKREDLVFMVQIICNRGFTELEEKHKNANKKQIKGILKKPQVEQSNQKDIMLNQAKQDLQPKMQQLVQMVEQKQNHSQESILTLLHDIIQKLKEIGEEQYIKNFKSFLETKLNDKQSIITEQERIKSQQEQQRTRIEQLQTINPIQAQRLRAYKTKHCHNFHSSIGCTRGDNCNFIHDSRYPGRPAPILQNPNFLNKTLYPQSSMQSIIPPLLQQLNPTYLLGRLKKYDSL
ncbi:unnamed protein product [Paramecium octaurelia]|uniref:C3H1-type domain-containing protein n=1 Tax=Paramecium octaurelia TaxID=43137 RepID=A0A8S1TID2_PAROT|nr:unnamed protein product [Paramecium octaurelia]